MGSKGKIWGITAVTAATLSAYFLKQRLAGRPGHLNLPGASGRRGYALITGASSGIGEAFARRLAAEGYSLLLIARRQNRLEALAGELRQQHGVAVETLAADLSQVADIAHVEQRIGKLDLTILVNNAGFGSNKPLAESDLDVQVDMLNLHVQATMRLCRAALPGMIARGRGAIINVSSISAFFPSPGDVNYPASKAYMNVFSQALQAEVFRHGIKVQALCPGFTHTEFHSTPIMTGFQKKRVPALLWMSAEEVVAESLRCLGKDRVICVPGRRYQLLVFGAQNGLAGLALRFARRFRHRSGES